MSAEQYSLCMNKEYLFITEKGKCFYGIFLENDFLHLTGIDLNDKRFDSRFFAMCKNKTLRIDNISSVQSHDYHNIINKLKKLSLLVSFVENKIDGQNLIIENPSTLTREFKFALRNEKVHYTLEFDQKNNARSNRTELVAKGSSYEKINYIFSSTGKNEFDTLIYIDEKCNIVDFVINNQDKFVVTKNGGLRIVK